MHTKMKTRSDSQQYSTPLNESLSPRRSSSNTSTPSHSFQRSSPIRQERIQISSPIRSRSESQQYSTPIKETFTPPRSSSNTSTPSHSFHRSSPIYKERSQLASPKRNQPFGTPVSPIGVNSGGSSSSSRSEKQESLR